MLYIQALRLLVTSAVISSGMVYRPPAIHLMPWLTAEHHEPEGRPLFLLLTYMILRSLAVLYAYVRHAKHYDLGVARHHPYYGALSLFSPYTHGVAYSANSSRYAVLLSTTITCSGTCRLAARRAAGGGSGDACSGRHGGR